MFRQMNEVRAALRKIGRAAVVLQDGTEKYDTVHIRWVSEGCYFKVQPSPTFPRQ